MQTLTIFVTVLICGEQLLHCSSLYSFSAKKYLAFNLMDAHEVAERKPIPGARQLVQGTVPSIVSTSGTCLCVPPGSCSYQNTQQPPTDGNGIDIRIVNNPYQSTTSPISCSYGLVQCCELGGYRCGRRFPPPPGSALSSPGQAAFGAYPWQAALLTAADVYLGSGALIDNRHILTTAHKVSNMPISLIKVRLGEWDASTTSEPIPAEDISIARIFIHPSFNKENLLNDVAIIRLTRNVDLTKKSTIGTICLPTTPFVGQRCFVAGWGKNDFSPSGAYQAIQREVDVSLVTNVACQAALRNTRLGAAFTLNDASFICAGGENGKDACTGDGGSPLVCQSNGRWYVVGLVAWGIGCATAGIPGVYVNVATFLPWIQTTVLTP